ncbi:similar to Saccharomyces cerevisiae YNR038W DBP6 Essential protein involved in ribosome biogenesis [Maudiozyma barnettii]|uniref:ATP-dependent RNA helicase n=1 Tax=Maudiozyma barnettii TaxID=61262 RepID=A0A8H2VHA9_9SACH|nr:putative ATP-dependent RNA helicase DBP6 [Kazachstania barnettii]CAB4255426.1 similar to Saccharomyces cerevisiae YNR038W DBP6 Essential protein involved in ribosome biogenesis [Kazachstania barnettii]CAD1783855.1 similar to Saccharomyces cerevisiae YNR038W DBP6 Essential protein involved in ribosome biogenesis [Kazachstania barnettii]
MFAARFDPTKIVDSSQTNEEQEQKKTVIPLKRTRDVESESEEEDEHEDESEEQDKEETAKNEISEVSDSENESEPEVEDNTPIEDGDDDKHTLVMSRFHQTLSLQESIQKYDKTSENDSKITTNSDLQPSFDNADNVATHELEFIPQPDIVRADKTMKSAIEESHSTAWINTKKVYYDNTMIKQFDEYKDELTPNLLQNIQRNFSTNTFAIQTILLDNILHVLNRSMKLTKKNLTRRIGDLLINASTGSGKTLAYSIPIIQALSNRTVNRLRVLIIVPTKLLIQQVFDTLNKLVKGTGIIITTAKMDQSLREESRKLQQSEPDIFITTPGRLVDHLQLKSISLKNLKFLILDEADRLLNQSFQNWCSELMTTIDNDKLDHLPGNVVKMVFSATLSTDTQKLHDLHLYNPRLFLIDSVKLYNLPSTLQEFNITVPTAKSMYKPLLLLHLLPLLSSTAKVIVFVKSNEASLRLATLINIILQKKNMINNVSVNSFNSNNSRAQNRKLVTEFSETKTDQSHASILITTDIMSRGIDITNVTDIVNYDVPISSQQYVHRCGRTARAGASGNAYNYLVGRGEKKFWTQHVSNDISRDIHGFEPKFWSKPDNLDEDGDIDMEKSEKVEDNISVENYNSIMEISDSEDTLYKEALNDLKEMASTK